MATPSIEVRMDSGRPIGAELPLLPYELKHASSQTKIAYAERQLRIYGRVHLVTVGVFGLMLLMAAGRLWREPGPTTLSVIQAVLSAAALMLSILGWRSSSRSWRALIESLRQPSGG